MTKDNLQYPIGKFKIPEMMTPELRAVWIHTLRQFPQKIKKAVDGLDRNKLDTAYREGGWTLRQVVHHCADSHVNAYVRFKLALTEENPTVKPYEEARWADLPDSKSGDVEYSLRLIEAIHAKWVMVLEYMPEKDFERNYFHPESQRTFSLGQVLANYAWHCEHHLMHVLSARQRNGWL